MPNVAGIQLKAARPRCDERGFEVERPRVRDDGAGRPGDRARTPSRGSSVDEGSTVTLTVSAGPAPAHGARRDGPVARLGAKAAVKRAGFKVERRGDLGPVPDGQRDLAPSPPRGTQLDKGSTVTLVVSTGPQQVAVPDVVGRARTTARVAARAAPGCRSTSSRARTSRTRPRAPCCARTRRRGTQVDEGSTVTLTVAKEPPRTTVPDVVGPRARTRRSRRCAAPAFDVTADSRSTCTTPTRTAWSEQDPGRRPRGRQGSTVTIIVGRFDADSPRRRTGDRRRADATP